MKIKFKEILPHFAPATATGVEYNCIKNKYGSHYDIDGVCFGWIGAHDFGCVEFIEDQKTEPNIGGSIGSLVGQKMKSLNIEFVE